MKGFSLILRRWLPVALWIGLVILASTNMGSGATTSSIVRPILIWLFPELPNSDVREIHMLIRKSAHVIQFFVLALLLWRAARIAPALPLSDKGLAIWVVAVSAVLASLSEAMQLMMSLRGASSADVVLDIGGALLGLLAILFWKAFRPPASSTSIGPA